MSKRERGDGSTWFERLINNAPFFNQLSAEDQQELRDYNRNPEEYIRKVERRNFQSMLNMNASDEEMQAYIDRKVSEYNAVSERQAAEQREREYNECMHDADE